MTQIEQIKSRIEHLAETLPEVRSTMEGLLSFIESLEKEQDVDLEKEMNRLVSLEYNNSPDDKWEMCIAHYFYELGLNTRKEE